MSESISVPVKEFHLEVLYRVLDLCPVFENPKLSEIKV